MSSWNSPSYGPILVDGHGDVLYLYTPDGTGGAPTCTGGCAAAWPPLTASGPPHAEGGAQQSLLGVSHGVVTYNGHPLYRYAGDSGPDEAYREGSGGIWYVVSTGGNAVT